MGRAVAGQGDFQIDQPFELGFLLFRQVFLDHVVLSVHGVDHLVILLIEEIR